MTTFDDEAQSLPLNDPLSPILNILLRPHRLSHPMLNRRCHGHRRHTSAPSQPDEEAIQKRPSRRTGCLRYAMSSLLITFSHPSSPLTVNLPDNTLRWLFSAQRQAENHGLYPEPITSIDDSLEGLEEDPSFQEDSTTTSLPKPDPLQKTLHHFFRPASAPARVSLAEANGNNATPNNSTDTNPSLSASTHVMSSQVPSSSSTSVGDASLSLSTTSGAGPGNGTGAVECEDIDMDRDTHTFTASATALTPAFQQRVWMDGKDLTQPSSCYYLLS